jgi:hypothetical protein
MNAADAEWSTAMRIVRASTFVALPSGGEKIRNRKLYEKQGLYRVPATAGWSQAQPDGEEYARRVSENRAHGVLREGRVNPRSTLFSLPFFSRVGTIYFPFPLATESLSPFFAEFFQSGHFQIFRGHDDPELDVSVERQKPRFGKCGYLRRGIQINDQYRPPLSILLGEVNRLGFELLQDVLDLPADTTVPNRHVEFLMGERYIHEHAHG